MSAAPLHAYSLLAELLEYPTRSVGSVARMCARLLASRSLDAAEEVTAFERLAGELDVRDLEELYAAVFDFSPARTLDLGYQLFGETYKRGAFLVKMKEAVRLHGISAGVELPDSLPVVLRLLAVLSRDDAPRELAEEVILPAVEKVLGTFQDDGGGYRLLLLAVKQVLMADFGIDHVESAKATDLPAVTGRRLPLFPGFHPPTEGVMS